MAIETATVVISFGESSEETGTKVSAEVDDRDDGYNNGKTSFSPGDSVGILLFRPTGSTVLSTLSSLGGLSRIHSTSKEVDVVQSIADTRDISLNYPVGSLFTKKWYGVDLGGVVKVNDFNLRLSRTEQVLGDHWVGMLGLTYESPCDLYVLSNTYLANEDSYQIICMFVVEVD